MDRRHRQYITDWTQSSQLLPPSQRFLPPRGYTALKYSPFSGNTLQNQEHTHANKHSNSDDVSNGKDNVPNNPTIRIGSSYDSNDNYDDDEYEPIHLSLQHNHAIERYGDGRSGGSGSFSRKGRFYDDLDLFNVKNHRNATPLRSSIEDAGWDEDYNDYDEDNYADCDENRNWKEDTLWASLDCYGDDEMEEDGDDNDVNVDDNGSYSHYDTTFHPLVHFPSSIPPLVPSHLCYYSPSNPVPGPIPPHPQSPHQFPLPPHFYTNTNTQPQGHFPGSHTGWPANSDL